MYIGVCVVVNVVGWWKPYCSPLSHCGLKARSITIGR